MKHNMIFLPWVGAVIGLLSLGLHFFFTVLPLPVVSRVALYSLLPLLVTGGFHVDGYMDVQDALKSYKSPEEKLEILKDPHIGAFAVIRLLMYALVWGAALAVLTEHGNEKLMYAYCVIFFLARAVSTLSSLTFKHARKQGMLQMETEKSDRIDVVMGGVQSLLALLVAGVFSIPLALAMALTCGVHVLYYKRLCYTQFGGVTGDTAGFYITTLEEWLLVVISVMSFFIS